MPTTCAPASRKREVDRVDRGHPGGGAEGSAAPFQRRHALLEGRDGGVPEARVLVAGILSEEPGRAFVGIAEREGRRLVDRRRDGSRGRVGVLSCVNEPGGHLHRPVVRHVASFPTLASGGPPRPLARRVVQLVFVRVLAAAPGHVVDRLEERLELLLADGGGEADPDPARLLADVPLVQTVADGLRPLFVDVKEEVSVGTRAHAARADLNAEEIVQEPGGEIVMEVPEDHRQDSEPVRREVPENDEIVALAPLPERPPEVVLLDPPNPGGAHRRFQVEGETGLDRLDDRRRPSRLPKRDGREIPVIPRRRVENGPASGLRRNAIREEASVRDEESRRPWPCRGTCERKRRRRRGRRRDPPPGACRRRRRDPRPRSRRTPSAPCR